MMKLEFEMTDLGMMRYFLGLEIKQEKSRIFVSQGAYARKILQKFGMHDCNPVATPMELGAKLSKLEGGEDVDSNTYQSIIGSLRYLTCTKPDIAFVVGVASQFMEDPRHSHLKVVKRILRYVKGTEDLGLLYQKTDILELTSYVDSDWCGDIDNRKSTTGYVFFMRGTAFTWLSKKQPIVTLLTYEAEYVAASLGVSHAIWFRRLL
jgi:Reverse transcriptase (RNA-dependent DNA polymerase)